MTPSSPFSNGYSPLTVKTSFTCNSNASFEGPRMSLLAKVNDLREEGGSASMRRKKSAGGVGLGIGYRGSVERRTEGVRWSPEVGRRF